MEMHPSRRSSLFLIELMIAILFFILAATICVSLFVKSHNLNQESQNLNHAVNAAVSVTEVFNHCQDPLNRLIELYPEGMADDSSFTIYYTSNWELCSSTEAIFALRLTTSIEDSMMFGTIRVMEPENVLYQLELKKYTGLEGGTHEI